MMKRNEGIFKLTSYAAAVALVFTVAVSFTASGVHAKHVKVNALSYTNWFTTEENKTPDPDPDPTTTATNATTATTAATTTSTTKNNPTPDPTTTTIKNTVKPTKPVTTTTTSGTSAKTSDTKTGTTRKKSNSPVSATVAFYTVTFNTNGGAQINNQTVKDGGNVKQPSDPIRQGFKFEGWFKDAKFNEPLDFKNDKVAGNVTVYAKWSPLAGTVTHKITFKGNSDSGYVEANPSEAVGGETVTLTIHPGEGKIVKAGTLSVNGSPISSLSFRMPEGDVEIYAEFEDAPVIKEPSGQLSKKIVIVGVLVILLAVTLIVMGIVLRERTADETEPEWTDHSIVISQYRKKESEEEPDGNTDEADGDTE